MKLPGFEDKDYEKNPNNPGNLKGYYYKPDGLPSNAPLVVALHGCAQRACDYDDETGWKALAERYKFVLLLPEQQELNLQQQGLNILNFLDPTGNPARCFSWWRTGLGDANGERESIMNMIKQTFDQFALDPERIYITGLSGGGAMTVTMLASYPDCFAGGAPMAGVPFRCTGKVEYRDPGDPWFWSYVSKLVGRECMCIDPGNVLPEIIPDVANYNQAHAQCMNIELKTDPVEGRTAELWGEQVRAMHQKPEGIKWPRISIWQGARDDKVAPINLERLKLQWTNLHGIDPATGTVVQEQDASPYDIEHETYADASGLTQVETYLIKSKDPTQPTPATGHATAIDPDGTSGWNCGCASGDCKCEMEGTGCNNKLEYIRDANICSSLRVAQFWGLDKPTSPSSGRRCNALSD